MISGTPITAFCGLFSPTSSSIPFAFASFPLFGAFDVLAKAFAGGGPAWDVNVGAGFFAANLDPGRAMPDMLGWGWRDAAESGFSRDGSLKPRGGDAYGCAEGMRRYCEA